MTCIECNQLLPRDHIRLTEQAAMCQRCYAWVEQAWLDEYLGSITPQGVPSYCPHPRELRERIEALRARIGDEPHDAKATNTVYERMRTTLKCERKPARTI